MKPKRQLNLSGLRVLDGGLATELEAKGCDLTGPLWSGRVLRDQPEQIEAVHLAYLEAGADCISTASYQVSRESFPCRRPSCRRSGTGTPPIRRNCRASLHRLSSETSSSRLAGCLARTVRRSPAQRRGVHRHLRPRSLCADRISSAPCPRARVHRRGLSAL